MKAIIFIIVAWLSGCCGYVVIDTIDKIHKISVVKKEVKKSKNG